MSEQSFVVPLADLERGPKDASFTVSVDWLSAALDGSEAEPRGQDGLLKVTLTKDGDQVVVRGSLHVALTIPCARTLKPVALDIEPEVLLLLRSAPRPGARGHRRRKRSECAEQHLAEEKDPRSPSGKWAKDPILSLTDAAEDRLHGEEVVLDDLVRQLILLELPMFPLQEGLRPTEDPATVPPSAGRPDSNRPIDPRLKPLATIADRLRREKE